MQPRRSPRWAELSAYQRGDSVSMSLNDDDTESVQSTAVCALCGDQSLRSSLVRIPCCDYLTHQMCVDDDIDALCPYCSMDLRHTLAHLGNSFCPNQLFLLLQVMGHSVCFHVALNLRIMSSVSPELPSSKGDSVFCPRCQRGRRDHVDVGWFQRMCHINGLDWPPPPKPTACCARTRWVTTVLQFHVAITRSTLAALPSLSMPAG